MLYSDTMKPNQYSQELMKTIREYYLNNDVSFHYMSDNSTDLFGRFVSREIILYMSRTDPLGRWSILKQHQGRKSEEIPIREKLERMANKLYDIMADEEEDLPVTQLVQVAKTWSDMIDKAKMGKETSTAKTSTQQVKDIFEEMEALSRSNG
jgi:hypothetical protein